MSSLLLAAQSSGFEDNKATRVDFYEPLYRVSVSIFKTKPKDKFID